LYDSLPQGTNIFAANNWWGQTVSSNIQAMIYDYVNNSALSVVNFTPPLTSPDTNAPVMPPVNVVKKDLGTGSIILSWNANLESDLVGYRVYYGSPTGFSFANSINVGNVTTYTLSGASLSDTIAVTAYDKQRSASLTTLQNQEAGHESWYTNAAPPSAPVLIAPANNTVNQPISLTMSWNTLSGATSYRVQVTTGFGFSTAVFDQGGLSVSTQALGPLYYGTTYYWRVDAVGTTMGTTEWSGIWSFTTIISAPAVPILSSPSNHAVNEPLAVILSWGTVTGAAAYALQTSSAPDFSSFVFNQSNLTSANEMVDSLQTNTLYYWRVNASNAGGASLWSDAWTFTTVYSGVLASTKNVMKTNFSIKSSILFYTIAKPCAIEISIFDMHGRKTCGIHRMVSTGSYSLPLKTLSLAPGGYVVQFKTPGFEKRLLMVLSGR